MKTFPTLFSLFLARSPLVSLYRSLHLFESTISVVLHYPPLALPYFLCKEEVGFRNYSANGGKLFLKAGKSRGRKEKEKKEKGWEREREGKIAFIDFSFTSPHFLFFIPLPRFRTLFSSILRKEYKKENFSFDFFLTLLLFLGFFDLPPIFHSPFASLFLRPPNLSTCSLFPLSRNATKGGFFVCREKRREERSRGERIGREEGEEEARGEREREKKKDGEL